jgi:hypothetical protein
VSTATRTDATGTTPAGSCNHTLCHTDPSGSWLNVPGKGGARKVVCRSCGRFFGYIASQARPETPALLDRRRRRATK